MINMYVKEYYVTGVDVNKYQQLKISRMFSVFQQLGTDHIDQLGYGDEITRDRGFYWILARQRAEITRMPHYNETVVFRTWTGPTSHMLFPRFYQIETQDGEVLVRASAMWTLLDANTRTLASSDDITIGLESDLTGDEISTAANPRCKETENHVKFVVPFSYIDMNGHMNNTTYLDKAEDVIPAPSEGLMPRVVLAKYASEAMEGAELDINWQYTPDENATDEKHTGKYYVEYVSSDVTHMKLQLEY